MDPRFRKWTDDEIKDLWENYPTGEISEIAKRLGRSENAIIQKAQLLGIVKKVRKKPVITKKRISVASEDAFLPKVNHIQALQNLDDKVAVFLLALKRYKLPENIKNFVSEIEFLQRVVVVRRQVECGFRKVN